MKTKTLEKAVGLSRKTGSVFIGTADGAGMPHIAAAGKMELAGKDKVAITEWFCPGTVANIQTNKHISVIVWDKDSDNGYQILGQIEQIQDLGVLDGYAPGSEPVHPLPQVEKQLLVRVLKIIDFEPGPHSDVEN